MSFNSLNSNLMSHRYHGTLDRSYIKATMDRNCIKAYIVLHVPVIGGEEWPRVSKSNMTCFTPQITNEILEVSARLNKQ